MTINKDMFLKVTEDIVSDDIYYLVLWHVTTYVTNDQDQVSGEISKREDFRAKKFFVFKNYEAAMAVKNQIVSEIDSVPAQERLQHMRDNWLVYTSGNQQDIDPYVIEVTDQFPMDYSTSTRYTRGKLA